jgi:hypothetical protein
MTLRLIRVRPASDADADLWRLTRQVGEILRGIPWVLIGGHIVLPVTARLHGLTRVVHTRTIE